MMSGLLIPPEKEARMSIYQRGQSIYYDFWYRKWRYRGSFGLVSRKTAAAQERKLKVQVAEGHFARPETPDMPTFGAFSHQFSEWYRLHHRPQSAQRYGYTLRRLERAFAGLLLADITPLRIAHYTTARLAQPCKPATVNLDLEVLRHVLRTAQRWGLLKAEQVPEIPKMRDDEAEIRVITAEEERQPLEARHARLRPLVAFGLYTGWRRGELVGLRWEDIDWRVPAARVVSVRAKSRRSRQIPLCRTALDILRDLPQDAAWVFGCRNVANSFR
jgi:integrase